MKQNKTMKKLVVTSLVGLTVGSQLFGMSHVLSAQATSVVSVAPTDPAIKTVNNLVFAKNIAAGVKPTITSTAEFDKADLVADAADAPKIENNKDYGWSQLKFGSLSMSDTVTITFPDAGTYQGKKVSLKMTLSAFYKSGSSYYNEIKKDDPATTLFINDLAYNGLVFRGVETFKMKYEFFADGALVTFNNDAYINANSLNGYDEHLKFNGSKLKDDPYFANYPHLSEGISYVNQDASSNTYLVQGGNIKEFPLEELSPGNPTARNTTLYAGANNNFEDALGAPTFTKNTVSYQLKGNAPEFFVVASRGSAWIAPSGATLFNTLPPLPKKAVSDSDEKFVEKDKLKDIEDGIKNGVQYSITQQTGVLGNDLLTQYSEFSFKDTLNEVYDMKTVKVTMLMGGKGEDVTSKFDISVNGQTVVAKAKPELLSDLSIYDARDFTMNIDVKIDATKAHLISTKVTNITNKAEVSINNTAQVTNQVETTVSRKPMTIVKTVDKKEAKVGDEILYTVTVSNPEAVAQTGEITDDISDVLEYSDYVKESLQIDKKAQTDKKDTDNAEIDKTKISARIQVPAKGKVVLNFKVKANQSTKNDSMDNVATLKTKDGDVPSNKVTTIVPQVGELEIKKEVNKAKAEVGEVVTYKLYVENKSNAQLDATVTDDLKQIVHADYEINSVKVDDKAVTDEIDTDNTEVTTSVLKTKLGMMKPKETHVIEFKVKVKAGTENKIFTNTAKLNDKPSNEVKTEVLSKPKPVFNFPTLPEILDALPKTHGVFGIEGVLAGTSSLLLGVGAYLKRCKK